MANENAGGTGSGWEAGGLIGGVLGSVGSGLGWGAASWQKDTASAASSKAWKRAMFAANTEMVRRVQDLKNAGLNPILAAGGSGAGSPAPGAAMAPGVDADITGGFGRGAASAREVQIQNAAIRTAEANQKAAEANATTARNTAAASRFDPLRREFETEAANHYAENLVKTGLLLESQKASTDAMSARTNLDAELMKYSLPDARGRARWVLENPGMFNTEQNARALAPAVSSAAQIWNSGFRLRR